MSIPIEKTNVVNGNNIEAQDILNIIEALDGTTDNSITITGPLSQGKSTVASGDWSHAEGNITTAQGNFSHAEGESTKATGESSHAEGLDTLATGSYSHAEGNGTIASGSYSHAEGVNTIAQGSYSHAEGESTTAQGDYSHTEGYGTIAQGSYSHAEGDSTIASGSYQHVSGKYNTQGDTTSLFIVGNGTEGSRADAFKVTHSSSIVIPIQKVAPTYSGSNGEMVPIETGGGHFYLYRFVSGSGWKRTEFT